MEAMASGKALERIYMQSTIHGESVEQIRRVAERSQVPVKQGAGES
jgi:hypothetical protein